MVGLLRQPVTIEEVGEPLHGYAYRAFLFGGNPARTAIDKPSFQHYATVRLVAFYACPQLGGATRCGLGLAFKLSRMTMPIGLAQVVSFVVLGS